MYKSLYHSRILTVTFSWKETAMSLLELSFSASAASTERLFLFTATMEADEQCIGSPVGLFHATFPQCRTLRQLLNQLRHLGHRAVLQYSASGLLFQVPSPEFRLALM
jgi:hypothetical protein